MHIDGLLHLGSISIAVTLAYYGLDKLDRITDPFINALKEDKECYDIARKTLSRLGYIQNQDYTGPCSENRNILKKYHGIIWHCCILAELNGFKSIKLFFRWCLKRKVIQSTFLLFSTITSSSFFILVFASMTYTPDDNFTNRLCLIALYSIFIIQIFSVAIIVAIAKSVEDHLRRHNAELRDQIHQAYGFAINEHERIRADIMSIASTPVSKPST